MVQLQRPNDDSRQPHQAQLTHNNPAEMILHTTRAISVTLFMAHGDSDLPDVAIGSKRHHPDATRGRVSAGWMGRFLNLFKFGRLHLCVNYEPFCIYLPKYRTIAFYQPCDKRHSGSDWFDWIIH